MLKAIQIYCFILLSACIAASQDTPTKIIEPTGNLPYRKVVIPAIRYSKIFSINSHLELAGQVKNTSCIEVLTLDGTVTRSTCLSSDQGYVVSLLLSDSGWIAGTSRQSEYSESDQFQVFRISPSGTLEVLARPTAALNLRVALVTGINNAGVFSGYFAESEYANLDGSDIVVSMVGVPNSAPQQITTPDSIGEMALGITDQKIFGSARKSKTGGFDITGWVYDLDNSTSSFPLNSLASIQSHSSSGEFSTTNSNSTESRLYNASGEFVGLHLGSYDPDDQKFHKRTIESVRASSTDGYHLWNSAFGYYDQPGYMEKDGKLSRSFRCAINFRSESSTLQQLIPGGVVLYSDDYVVGQYAPVVFIPSTKDELEDRCLFVHFKIPDESHKNLKTGYTCNAGYLLKERKNITDGAQLPMGFKVFNSQGHAVSKAKIALEIPGDHKGTVKKVITNAHGQASITIPFLKAARQAQLCGVANFNVTKSGFYPVSTLVLNPDGNCGSCV